MLYLCLCSREPFIILSGGLSYDTVGRRPCLTVMHGKSTAVLEMDYPIVDFLTLCETPYPNGKLLWTSSYGVCARLSIISVWELSPYAPLESHTHTHLSIF